MFTNSLKIAWRNLWSNRLFSLINMVSLAIGISASLIIGLIVYYDYSFDTFHQNGDRIFRVTSIFTNKDGTFYNAGASVPLGTTLQQGMSGVDKATALFSAMPVNVRSGKTLYKKPEQVAYADGNYFAVFSYTWLAGAKRSALSAPNQIVLTQSRAQKYFPGLSAAEILGRTLVYDDSLALNVSGIVQDLAKPSDLIYKEFISVKTVRRPGMESQPANTSWDNTSSSAQIFVKLTGADAVSSVQKQLDFIAKEHTNKQSAQFGETRRFHLQPLRELHFDADYGTFDGGTLTASKNVLLGLGGIALFLLLLGSINFVNLSTAQATHRAKEIGVRKTLGSSKAQLMIQFLSETFLLTLMAALASLLLSAFLLRTFAGFIPPGMTSGLVTRPAVLAGMLALIVLVTLASGFYPALVLTRFRPVSVLKNQPGAGRRVHRSANFLP